MAAVDRGDRARPFDPRRQPAFGSDVELREAQRMEEGLSKAQEEAANEVVGASAGSGMVTVKANRAEEMVSITIDPRPIPRIPNCSRDMILAAVNEALRSACALMESEMSGLIPGDLGGLLPG